MRTLLKIGLDRLTKDKFCEDLEDFLQKIGTSESKLLCGDLNGHLGHHAEGFSECHGGYGIGTRNE